MDECRYCFRDHNVILSKLTAAEAGLFVKMFQVIAQGHPISSDPVVAAKRVGLHPASYCKILSKLVAKRILTMDGPTPRMPYGERIRADRIGFPDPNFGPPVPADIETCTSTDVGIRSSMAMRSTEMRRGK